MVVSIKQALLLCVHSVYPSMSVGVERRSEEARTSEASVSFPYETPFCFSLAGNYDTNDWQNPGNASLVSWVQNNIPTASASAPGIVLLMHELYQGTVTALPYIINNLKAKGYSFVTLVGF